MKYLWWGVLAFGMLVSQAIHAESDPVVEKQIIYEDIGDDIDSFFIQEIRFEGNKKTRPQIMLQEMNIKQGETVTRKRIEDARQNILNLDLFKDVNLRIKKEKSGYVLIFKVKEKFYWYVIPKFNRNGDGDISYGGEAQTDNLFGLNQTIELKYVIRQLQDIDVDEERTFDLNYYYPRVKGSPWDLRFRYRLLLSDLNEERGDLAGRYERDLKGVLFRLSRWLRSTGPSKGWRIGGSLSFQKYMHTFIEGDPDLFFDADVLALQLNGSFVNVDNFIYSRSGKHFGYEIEATSDALGSDVSYTRQFLFYRKYALVTKREHTNLNTQLRLETQTDSIFGDPALGAVGSKKLRGYDRQSLEGDTYLVGNLEYLSPFNKKHQALRGVVFADAGNSFDEFSDIDLSALKYAVGFGLRWKVRALVRVDLRLEVGRGLSEGGETKFYAGTRGTF